MITPSIESRRPPARRRLGLLLILLSVPLSTPVGRAAASASPESRHAIAVSKVEAGPAVGRTPTVLVGGVWNGFTRFLESTLNNRRRMIQFAVLGMCLALYIMIWRR
jgi:hypothetical protein